MYRPDRDRFRLRRQLAERTGHRTPGRGELSEKSSRTRGRRGTVTGVPVTFQVSRQFARSSSTHTPSARLPAISDGSPRKTSASWLATRTLFSPDALRIELPAVDFAFGHPAMQMHARPWLRAMKLCAKICRGCRARRSRGPGSPR